MYNYPPSAHRYYYNLDACYKSVLNSIPAISYGLKENSHLQMALRICVLLSWGCLGLLLTMHLAGAVPKPRIGNEARTYLTRKISPHLLEFGLAALTKTQPPEPRILKDVLRDAASFYDLGDLDCGVCKEIVYALDDYVHTDKVEKDVMNAAADFCKTARIESDRVCDYIVKEYRDMVFEILTMHYLSPDQVCGTLLGPSCAKTYDPNADWNITFPSVSKPPVNPVPLPRAGSPQLRILHISDLHIDLMYQAGTNSHCGDLICCRANDGPPKPPKPGAGVWGDRGCDTPSNLMENALADMSKNHQFDFIYMTGDLPAHDVWNQTRDDQLRVFDVSIDMLMKYFPGVKIYGSLGNHESAPCNSFPPLNVITGSQSVTWLYDHVARSWIEKAEWLPESTRETILHGGYYDVLLYPGLRLISLNMNAGLWLNWWLQINATDPDGQLQWLVGVLQRAEDAGEKVHIIGHVPPAENLPVWSKNYELIVKRYESTIVGQFFGHTHKDEFMIYYDNDTNRRPISVAYVTGSITPASQNSGYRFYIVDGNYKNSTWALLDHENYYLNLTDANLTNKPVWQLEYSAKKAYNMTSLQPSEWDGVVQRFKKDKDFFDLYFKHYYRLYIDKTCDEGCRNEMICKIETARNGDTSYC